MSEAETKVLDLSQFEMSESTTITIKNQKGDDDFVVNGEPVRVEVWSSGSKEGQRALRKAGLAAAARQVRLYRGELNKNDADDAERERVVKLSGFTKSISRNFPFAPEQIYANPKMNWFTRQIEETVGEDKLFLKAPSES